MTYNTQQIYKLHYVWHVPLSGIDKELGLAEGTAKVVILDSWKLKEREIKQIIEKG